MRTRTVLVPTDLALVYDGRCWRFAGSGEVPPAWWIEQTEPEIADEIPRQRRACTGPTCATYRERARRYARRAC